MQNITACVIYRSEDSVLLKDCIESIEQVGLPIVLMQTLPIESNKLIKKSVLISQNERIKYCEYYYEVNPNAVPYDMRSNKFSFADAKNECKKYAETEWILSIDADERLCAVKSEFDILESLPDAIAAVTVKLHNHIPEQLKPSANFEAGVHNVARIFRNKYDWFMRVHEQVVPNNATVDNLYYSPIMIKHIGYKNYGNLSDKHLRNIAMMSEEISKFKNLTTPQRNEFYLIDKLVAELQELFKYDEFNPGKVDILNIADVKQAVNYLRAHDVGVVFEIKTLADNIQYNCNALASNVRNRAALLSCFSAAKLYIQLMSEMN